MPNETHSSGSPAAALADDSDSAAQEVRRFLLDVIERGGGPKAVAQEFGYTESAVRSWRTMKTPAPDVLFRLARRYGVSLDQYALTASMRDELDDLRRRVEVLEDGAA